MQLVEMLTNQTRTQTRYLPILSVNLSCTHRQASIPSPQWLSRRGKKSKVVMADEQQSVGLAKRQGTIALYWLHSPLAAPGLGR